METFISKDGTVAKFIHEDGSETAVKVVKSCSNFKNAETGTIDTEWVDRNKFSVFISASLGCYLACKFCHLTIKGSAYKKLYTDQVVANVKEAILAELARKPEMRERYVKLCWMGMGDALNQPEMVYDATLQLMDWLIGNGYTRGLDCVDLSTVVPKVGDAWIERFRALNEALDAYPVNPDSFRIEQAEMATQKAYVGRTRFRLFYSVHSAIQETREKMVPRAMSLVDAIPLLQRLQADGGPNVLLHTVFVEGLNDKEEEIDSLLGFLGVHFPQNELRVLRYNASGESTYREIDHIDRAVSRIAEQHPAIKVQTSAGKDVAAACGQFLVAFPKSLGKGVRIAVIPVASPEHNPVALAA